MAAWCAAEPELGLGWPTVGWLNAAFRLMRAFEDPDFPRRTLTPILVVAAGADRVTDTRAAERFASRLRAGRIVIIDGAEHEMLMERDVFRDQFWAAFDAFIPGIEAEKARADLVTTTNAAHSRDAARARARAHRRLRRWRVSFSRRRSASGFDEAYTLVISRRLDLSYFDHPPLHQWIAHFAALAVRRGRRRRACRSSRCSRRRAGCCSR